MKMTKRVISLLLLVAMVFGMLPAAAQAQEVQTVLENGRPTVEGTNSFGSLLSAEIQEQPQEESGGYNVIGLTVQGSVATVEYSTLEAAYLVVSLYSEDGLQLLVSGRALVQPEATKAEVTLEGQLPEYFMASAFLMDTYDYSPLCSAYSTPMYTREMQELLASTTDDYDPDRVLNLDEDKTTNFAVYADSTKVLEYTEGVNVVVSADDETATYVIANADSDFTTLQVGDVIAYPYGEEELLLVKVGSIVVDGTTVTITGADLEMEEVFSHVKLETLGNTEDFTVDESTAAEGVEYEGMSSGDREAFNQQAIDVTIEYYHHFKLNMAKLEGPNSSTTVDGTVGISIKANFSYYCVGSRHFVDFRIDAGIKATIKLEGEVGGEIPLLSMRYSGYGVTIGIGPNLILKASGALEYTFNAFFTVGFTWDSVSGCKLVLDADATNKLEAEVDVFVGLNLAPWIEVVHGKLGKAELDVPIGIELSRVRDLFADDTDLDTNCIHNCEKCYALVVKVKGEYSASISLFDSKNSWKIDKVTLEFKLGDLYWSLDRDKCDWGTCPYKSYRVTVQIKDTSGQNVSGILVYALGKGQSTQIPMGATNSTGLTTAYLPAGSYTLTAIVGEETLQKSVTVTEAEKIILSVNAPEDDPLPEPGLLEEKGVIASGECGAEGDNVTWTLYDNGLLRIQGSGRMADYISTRRIPWYEYRYDIEKIYIGTGITHIGEYAFSECFSLCVVALPYSLISIGKGAFSQCISLTSIYIPDSVTSIEYIVFAACNSLSSIVVDAGNSVYHSASNCIIETATKTLIAGCKDSVIPKDGSVTSIGDYAFYECSSLTSIDLPDSVTNIGYAAFGYCRNLIVFTIPNGVTSIGDFAFCGCYDLTAIVIPDSVTSIGDVAFYACESLDFIRYYGTMAQWDAISKGIDWDLDTGFYVVACSDGEISKPTGAGPEVPGVPCKLTGKMPGASTSAIWDGVVESEITDQYTVKTASFAGLVPGEEYVLLVLASLEAQELLAPDNLLYIAQSVAAEDGTLSFRYVQREAADTAYVMACGASYNNLKDAVITFPEMRAEEEARPVEPTVAFGGKTLVEGVDYVILGTVDYTAAGTYTCYIRGINGYTGRVQCTYTVLPPYTAFFQAATATLDGKIGLNYYLTIEESVASDPEARMVFILNGNRTEVPISEAKVDNQGRYRFTIRLAASEMADIVQAQMFVGDTPVSKIQEYSLQKYASYRISNTTDEVERELMIAMLNYGAVSQVHFNHNVENLANSVLEEQLRGVLEVTAQDLAGYATVMSGTADGIKPKSATLLLQSGTSIRVYFQLTGTKTIDQYSFTIDGQPAIPIEKDGSYYLEVSSVPAAELGDTHVFTCDGITIEYSALTYVEVMLRTSTKTDIIDMVRGVYGYNIAAKAFFGK